MAAANAKHSIASNTRRARVKSKQSIIIVSESEVHILLLGVREHAIFHTARLEKDTETSPPFSKSQSKHMPATWRPVFVSFTNDATSLPFKEVVRLPSNVKKVSAIRLLGCKQTTQIPNWIKLNIKEAETNNNELITNDQYEATTFFVIPYNELLWDSSGKGLRCSTFTPRNMPTLTFELKDSHNQPLFQFPQTGIAQCLLWLEILVEGGD
jgi:hypothetical protein